MQNAHTHVWLQYKIYLTLRITNDFDTYLPPYKLPFNIFYEYNRQKIMINYLNWAITVITEMSLPWTFLYFSSISNWSYLFAFLLKSSTLWLHWNQYKIINIKFITFLHDIWRKGVSDHRYKNDKISYLYTHFTLLTRVWLLI